MQALQTLSQREFEMMQCFWEADEPLKMKELQTRWAHGETLFTLRRYYANVADPVGAWRNSAEPIHDTDLCKSVGGNEIFVQNGGAEATGAVSSDCYKRGLLQA